MNYFPKNLLHQRKINRLSMDQLSEAIGLSKNSISKYETGKQEPNLSTLYKIAKFFKIKPGEMLDYDLTNPEFKPELINPANKDYEKLLQLKEQIIATSDELIEDLKENNARSEEFINRLKQEIKLKDAENEKLKKRITELEKA